MGENIEFYSIFQLKALDENVVIGSWGSISVYAMVILHLLILV